MSSRQEKKERGAKEKAAKYYTEGGLSKLLAAKHSKDLYVPQCKTGSTWMHHIRIIDFWAMKRSWASPRFYAYEIKCSRGDFLQDDKWTQYLEYCTDFYFVAPPGLIEPSELPPEAGLMVCSKNCKRLYTKKKAQIRQDARPPLDLFLYILMSRAVIRDENQHNPSQREYWQAWLKDRELDHELGYRVSKALKEEINALNRRQNGEIQDLHIKLSRLERAQKMLDELGLDPGDVRTRNASSFKQQLDEAAGGMPDGFQRQLDNTIQVLQNLRGSLEEEKRMAVSK